MEVFKAFCGTDKNLAERTVYRHVLKIKMLARSLGKNPREIGEADLRAYL